MFASSFSFSCTVCVSLHMRSLNLLWNASADYITSEHACQAVFVPLTWCNMIHICQIVTRWEIPSTVQQSFAGATMQVARYQMIVFLLRSCGRVMAFPAIADVSLFIFLLAPLFIDTYWERSDYTCMLSAHLPPRHSFYPDSILKPNEGTVFVSLAHAFSILVSKRHWFITIILIILPTESQGGPNFAMIAIGVVVVVVIIAAVVFLQKW